MAGPTSLTVLTALFMTLSSDAMGQPGAGALHLIIPILTRESVGSKGKVAASCVDGITGLG
jgi:hypothetical protein